MASKKSGTFRPFARIEPIDLMLYQALVDQLAAVIEDTLGSRDEVMAYRQAIDADGDNPFEGAPKFVDYADRVEELVSDQIPDPVLEFSPFRFREPRPRGYVLNTDISGYFMHIDLDELEKSLLAEPSSPTEVVRTLATCFGSGACPASVDYPRASDRRRHSPTFI